MITIPQPKSLPPELQRKLDRQLARWYPLKDHAIQLQMIRENKRFKCVPAGRRSGKTERFKRYMSKVCMRTPNSLFFIAAPTSAQVEKIYWKDMKDLSLSCLHERPPSETKKIIFFNNGTELHLCSLDKADRMEGTPWDGGGIDEFASTKPDAWANLSPLFDTINPLKPDSRAWCWFLGVPDGLNHYYELCQQAETLEDWGVYAWPSSDILPKDVILAAKARMSLKQYKQEYEASFETVTGRIYEDYSKDNHTKEIIQDHELIHYFCDFNYTPMSHGVAVVRGNSIFVLDEVVLTSAKGYMNVTEFCEKYINHKNKKVMLYGDSSGSNGAKHGLDSEYSLMVDEFRKHGWDVSKKVKKANPAIKDRQNAVNAMIKNALGEIKLYVNPKAAVYMHKGLNTTVFKKGSTFQEEQKDNEYQHITTGLGYFIDYMFPIKQRHDFEKMRITSPWGN